MEKTASQGARLDLHFTVLRLSFFFDDRALTTRTLAVIHDILLQGSGDWDRRNRLKVYESLHCMRQRDFEKAANGFLSSLATFDSEEIMSFEQLVEYCLIMGVFALDRVKLKEKVALLNFSNFR